MYFLKHCYCHCCRQKGKSQLKRDDGGPLSFSDSTTPSGSSFLDPPPLLNPNLRWSLEVNFYCTYPGQLETKQGSVWVKLTVCTRVYLQANLCSGDPTSTLFLLVRHFEDSTLLVVFNTTNHS